MPYKDRDFANAKRRERRRNSGPRGYSRAAYLRWKARYPDGLWVQWLKKAHAMTPEQWFVMWIHQDGRCYLCEQRLPEDRSKVVIDHDHSHCGKKQSCAYCRRGLAHDYCNMLLGMLGEDIDRLRCMLTDFKGASFIANFECIQTQVQARMAAAPQQVGLF